MTDPHTTLFFAAACDREVATYVFAICEGPADNGNFWVDRYYAKPDSCQRRCKLIALSSALRLLTQTPSPGDITIVIDDRRLYRDLRIKGHGRASRKFRNWIGLPIADLDIWQEIHALSQELSRDRNNVLRFAFPKGRSWIQEFIRYKALSGQRAFHLDPILSAMVLPERPHPIWNLGAFGAAAHGAPLEGSKTFIMVPALDDAPATSMIEARCDTKSLNHLVPSAARNIAIGRLHE